MSTLPEYVAWNAMRQRCNNPKAENYQWYGGRGIRVSERWSGRHGFANFLADMGRRPSERHTLDRKDPDGNYEPGNCRWATMKEQSNNRRVRRDAILLTLDGVTRPVAEWARLYRLKSETLVRRLQRGLKPRQALEAPLRRVLVKRDAP